MVWPDLESGDMSTMLSISRYSDKNKIRGTCCIPGTHCSKHFFCVNIFNLHNTER